ncbi:MAG TPA: hypothetical protein VGS78_04855 [Candidatus Sulfotelmatobacter sp.]|nr:hypothetical protein [Candidatus Sulfotelmatobacter sp.]
MAANPKTAPPYPISITDGTPDPDSVSIDKDGSIQFTSDAEYTIEWEDEHGNKKTFWSPQPDTVSAGVNQAQDALPSADHHTLTFTLTDDTKEAQGGGTVKVGS